MVGKCLHEWGGLAVIGMAIGLGGAPARADMYRWVDARGVVNYSNIPPEDGVRATRIPDTQPTVSVIPPPDNQAELRRALREAALLRRIEQLEDEIAAVRQAPVTVVAVPAPQPVVTYTGPAFIPWWPVSPWPGRPVARWPGKPGSGHGPNWGHPGSGVGMHPGARSPGVSRGGHSGVTVRARF